MLQGVVKWFNNDKGFGFIQAEGKDYFVYFKDIDADGFKTLKDGQGVTFKPDTSPKGPVAKQVKVIG